MMKLPVCEPFLTGNELQYVTDCIRTNWVSSQGKYLEEFERRFSSYCGCRYGVGTTSGTTALHLAMKIAGIGKGDEVIVPAFTMISTVFAILYVGGVPVLVDSERSTGNMDVSRIAEKVTPRTRAIMPVHIYGHPCDMDVIMALARRHGLHVIEDAAEAHGAEYGGKKAGGIGGIGCFSFYGNKIITCGEGGMVVTNDQGLAQAAADLRNLAFSRERRFLHLELGFNYRMTNVQAAIGLAQFEKIDELVERRRKHARQYNELLSKVPGLTLPVEKKGAKNVYWMYALLVEDDFGLGRDELMQALQQEGIETRTFFIPMHQQPALCDMGLFQGETYPVAEELARRGLYLPSGSGLTELEIEYVCRALAAIQARTGKSRP